MPSTISQGKSEKVKDEADLWELTYTNKFIELIYNKFISIFLLVNIK